MKLSPLHIAFPILLLAIAPAYASDVFKLDIDGVRLGMSGEEAVAALKAKFGAKHKMDILKADSSVDQKHRAYQEIKLVDRDYILEVDFHDTTPGSPHPEMVTDVTLTSNAYGFGGDRRAEQEGMVEQEFLDSVLSKYPRPDYTKPCLDSGCPKLKEGQPWWCENVTPLERSPCQFQPYMLAGRFIDGSGNHFSVELHNPNGQRDFDRYMRSHVPDQHLTSKPFN